MESVAHRAAGTGRIFVVEGDLTRQRVDAVVNAANEHLAHGGGVAAAIVRTGGHVIQEESDQWVRDHGPVGPGQAVVTTGGALQAGHVIHVVGPRYRDDQDNEALLWEAVQAALDAAERWKFQSVAMPIISAGVFGYPRSRGGLDHRRHGLGVARGTFRRTAPRGSPGGRGRGRGRRPCCGARRLLISWPFSPPLKPMKARARDNPPEPPGWVYEPKWDGFRMIAWSGDEPRLDSRSGKPLLRYFPELAAALAQLPPGTVVDGEIVLVRDDVTQFDQLQLRIHPAASRIALLSNEIPADLVAFDLLADRGEDLRTMPHSERRARLEALFSGLDHPWHLTPITEDLEVARRWFDEYEAAGCDGIICKQADGEYVEDKRVWLKWKHRRDCDCVVGGYRVHKDGDKIGSILLGVYNDAGELHFVGHCSGFSDHDRVELLAQFEQIRSDESFGGGDVRVPGAESRWSVGKDLSWIPVTPGVVVQVSYDQIERGRFRHATRFERWRFDKAPEECTMDQLVRPEGSGFGEVVSRP